MSGETALARQLKKLAVPQTTVLIQDKIRKSILFDHREASSLDKEVIFAFGTCGLEKLCTLNPLFSKFENDLFSLSYKDFQRSVQSASVNEKLDAKISEFLWMISPYFKIREAREALEWLIYRFHIHLYNVDVLIASVLPHFNTETFVLVVQLLDLNEKSRWFWLKPVQTNGVHLEYSAILNRFLTDSGFRKFVCDIAPNVLAVYTQDKKIAVPIISFSMCTIYNALEVCKIIEDKFINPLFPYIFDGLKSDLTEYISTSYLVISNILSRVKISSKVVEELLVKILQNLNDDLVLEACKILLLAFQTQAIKTLPTKVFSHFLTDTYSANTLFELLNNVKIFSVIKAFIKKSQLMLCKDGKGLKFLKLFLEHVGLNKKCATMLFNVTVTRMIKCSHENTKSSFKSFKKAAKYIFRFLEQKYPDHFDRVYKRFLEKKSHKTLICNLINKSVCNLKYTVGPNMETSLAVGLYHANAQIRQMSVVYLLHTFVRGEFCDREFVENSLNDRLLDDNPRVVLKILKFSQLSIVLQELDKFRILSAFEKILSRNIVLNSKWYNVQLKCLRIITRLYQNDGNKFEIIKLLLNFLFPINEHTCEGFLQLLNSSLKNPFIEKIRSCVNINDDITSERYPHLNYMIVSCLKEVLSEMNEELKIVFILTLNSKIAILKPDAVLVFYSYVMASLFEAKDISTKNRLLCVNAFLPVLSSYFSKFNNIAEKFEILSEECVIKKCIESLNNRHFPSHLILYTFYKLVVGLEPLNMVLFEMTWHNIVENYGDSYEILSKVFSFCNLYLYSHKELLREYFQTMLSLLISKQFKSVEEYFWFLSTKLLDSLESSTIKFNATNIAIALCKNQNKMHWFFEKPVIFFSVVKSVANHIPEISHSALLLLSLCVKSFPSGTNPFKSLGDEIIKKSEEIKIDYRQCSICVGNWLQAAIDYKDTKKSLKVGKELQSKIIVLDKILSLLSEDVPYSVKYFLLCCLQNNDSSTILSSYVPIMLNYLKMFEKFSNKDILNIVCLLIKKFTPKTAACFTEDSEESNALIYCLNFKKDDEKFDRCIQVFTLDVLNKEFFTAIVSDKIKLQIMENLLDLYIIPPPTINAKIEKVLKELCPYAYLFIRYHAEKMHTSKSTSLREAKKFKSAENDSLNKSESNMWRKITVLLELMQNEPNLLKKEIIISGLFSLLEKCKDNEKQENDVLIEYIRQLILSAIHNCYEQLSLSSQQEINYDDFHINKVIDCIEDSTNRKTHYQALLLLNLASTMFPDRILEKIMRIFVLMRTDLVRYGDDYSFQVLLQVIQTIMPSLLEANNQQTKTNGYQMVEHVIGEFVNTLSHIPGHRRLPLFTKIITTLDPSKYLWIPLGQICLKYADAFPDTLNDDTIKNVKNSDDSKTWKALEFAINLHQQFSPDIQIDTGINLTKFLLRLPDTKKQFENNPSLIEEIKELFDVKMHKNNIYKQLQIYKQNILYYMRSWLSSEMLLNQIAELSTKQQISLEEKYKLLLESILELLQARLNIMKSVKEDTKINEQVQLLYDIVHAINSLLPCKLFVQVVTQLLKNNEEIQLKAIELLNSKLEQEGEMLYVENCNLLMKLMKPLTELINSNLKKDDKNEKNIILQTAIYSLQLLCKLIGKEHRTKNISQKKIQKRFKEALEISVKVLMCYENPELIVNALLCVAQLCHCLNVDILRYLNHFMPIIINILQDEELLYMNDCLVLGIIATLNSIVENLGAFLSIYMEDIIVNICLHSVKYSELGKRNIAENFVILQTKLAKEIPLRIFMNVIRSCYSRLSIKNANSIIPLMKILTQNIEVSKYDDILGYSTELQDIYKALIDFRNANQSIPLETINLVESNIVSSLKTFVMKLSVSHFRIFFQSMYQWAVQNEGQMQKFRIFTFYKITCEFSKSLKSLFSVMSKYFFTHVSSVLDLCNFSKSKVHYFDSDPNLSHELLINILDTLKYCFMYSEEQFLDKEHFELLMHPLVDHLENLCDEVIYQELIDNHLKSCIAHFMVATSDSALWKSLNYQILLKTRHDSPKVRFGVLQVIMEVVSKMGDNYLTLLAESIPFLAEIMEDESSEVEQECQTVIVEMEKILGEPIRNYF